MTMLRQAIDSYLALRRSLGFKLRDTSICLHNFAQFMEERRRISLIVPGSKDLDAVSSAAAIALVTTFPRLMIWLNRSLQKPFDRSARNSPSHSANHCRACS